MTLSRLRRQELNLYAAELTLYGAATLEATSSNALLSGLHAHAEAAKDEALQQLADQASLPAAVCIFVIVSQCEVCMARIRCRCCFNDAFPNIFIFSKFCVICLHAQAAKSEASAASEASGAPKPPAATKNFSFFGMRK